jgi:hypothetical protein
MAFPLLWICAALSAQEAAPVNDVDDQPLNRDAGDDVGEIGVAEKSLKANERPAARSLSLEALQKWYGTAIDFKNDAELTRKVQSAEALVTALYLADDIALRAKWKTELLNLNLPPAVLRAVIRYGQVPLSPESTRGMIRISTPLIGYPGDTATADVSIPEGYTHDHPWPVILSLLSDNGMLGSAPGFIVINPYPHPGAPHRGYCWGPAMVARAVPWSTLDWTMLHFRVDPDRVYLHGHNGCFGGIGAKNHGTVYTDRIAALCPNGGPPLGPERGNVYRNLHDVPLLYSEATDNPANVLGKWETDTLNKLGIRYETKGDEFEFFKQHIRMRAPEKLRFSSFEDVPAALRHYYVEIAEANPDGNTEIIFNVKSFMNYYTPDKHKSWADDMMLEKTTSEKDVRHHYEEQLKDTVEALKDDNLYHPENGSMTKEERELLVKLFSEKNIDRYRVLLKQAQDAKLILETRPAWMKPREVDTHIDRYDNALIIDRTAFVKRLRILLDDDIFDMDKDITIKLGNKVLVKKKVERSSSFMIQEMIRTHRRDLTYWGEIVVPLN